MKDQTNLFASAFDAREEGMALVDEYTSQEWKDYADGFIEDYLRTHRTLHVDDLWDEGLEQPKSLRALGPRVRYAADRGFMQRTGRGRPSVRSHLTDKPVWESLIYEEA